MSFNVNNLGLGRYVEHKYQDLHLPMPKEPIAPSNVLQKSQGDKSMKNSSYSYSDKEKGSDGTINPNYYKDENGNQMLLDHLACIFNRDEYEGMSIGFIMKYLKRFRGKDGIQDLRKALTVLKHLISYEDQFYGDDDK